MSADRSAGGPWPVPIAFPPAPETAIHVWRIDLSVDYPSAEPASLLSEEERARSKRLRSPMHRARFERSRAALRGILGGYLGVAPESVIFEYGSAGKPRLRTAGRPGSRPLARRLSFNLSHSEGMALCAVGESGALGVDVEAVRPLRDIERLARRYFSHDELRAWSAAAEDDRALEFFRTWTRKEAMLKAAGFGLSRPLERVDTVGGTLEGRTYWLADIAPDDGFTGAVAGARAPSELLRWTWEKV